MKRPERKKLLTTLVSYYSQLNVVKSHVLVSGVQVQSNHHSEHWVGSVGTDFLRVALVTQSHNSGHLTSPYLLPNVNTCIWKDNLMERGAWWAAVQGVTQSWTNTFTFKGTY